MTDTGHIIREGEIDISAQLNSDNDFVRKEAQRAMALDTALRKAISPAGALKLRSALLDARRREFGIPDEAFKAQAAFERVYIWQLPELSRETFQETGIIVRPEAMRDRDRRTAPRGILLSAGLTALDYVRTHGMDLGHIVHFINMAPFHREIAKIEGKSFYVLVMNAGDITASEDTEQALRNGDQLRLESRTVDGRMEHYYRVPGEMPVRPVHVTTPEDY